MKRLTLVTATLLLAAPALAQATSGTTTTTTTTPDTSTVQPGSPAAANSGPGSVGTVSPSGTGADRATNNPAADANAEKQEQGAPNTGKGGSSGSGGG